LLDSFLAVFSLYSGCAAVREAFLQGRPIATKHNNLKGRNFLIFHPTRQSLLEEPKSDLRALSGNRRVHTEGFRMVPAQAPKPMAKQQGEVTAWS